MVSAVFTKVLLHYVKQRTYQRRNSETSYTAVLRTVNATLHIVMDLDERKGMLRISKRLVLCNRKLKNAEFCILVTYARNM